MQAAPVMRKLYNSAEQCLNLPVRTGLTGDHYSLTKQWVFQTARECIQAPLLQTLSNDRFYFYYFTSTTVIMLMLNSHRADFTVQGRKPVSLAICPCQIRSYVKNVDSTFAA